MTDSDVMISGLRKIAAIVSGALDREDPKTWETLRFAQSRGAALDQVGAALIEVEDALDIDLLDEEVKA